MRIVLQGEHDTRTALLPWKLVLLLKKSSKQTEQRSVLFISQFNIKGMYPICSVVHYTS